MPEWNGFSMKLFVCRFWRRWFTALTWATRPSRCTSTDSGRTASWKSSFVREIWNETTDSKSAPCAIDTQRPSIRRRFVFPTCKLSMKAVVSSRFHPSLRVWPRCVLPDLYPRLSRIWLESMQFFSAVSLLPLKNAPHGATQSHLSENMTSSSKPEVHNVEYRNAIICHMVHEFLYSVEACCQLHYVRVFTLTLSRSSVLRWVSSTTWFILCGRRGQSWCFQTVSRSSTRSSRTASGTRHAVDDVRRAAAARWSSRRTPTTTTTTNYHSTHPILATASIRHKPIYSGNVTVGLGRRLNQP